MTPDNKPPITVRACPECVEKTQQLFTLVRPVFRAMRDAGIPDYISEQVMGFLLDKLDPDEKYRSMHYPPEAG